MFKTLMTFLRESYAELKRVTWPSRKETLGSTTVVFIVVGIIMLFIALFDFLLTIVFKLLV